MNKRSFTLPLVALVAPLVAASGVTAQEQTRPARVTGENRLFSRFVEDAALVPSFWLEGRAFYESQQAPLDPSFSTSGEADTFGLGPVFAFNVAEDFEFGGRISYLRRDPDRAGSESGLGDLETWGKLAVVTVPVKVAVGLLVSVPTGDEDKFLGTGETEVEFFTALRKDFSRLTLAANAGVRVNQDADFAGTRLEGKNSALLGGALLVPVGDRVVLTAELSVETERYDGVKTDSRLLGGFEFRSTSSFMVRGAVGGGLSDGAPEFQMTGGAVWLF